MQITPFSDKWKTNPYKIIKVNLHLNPEREQNRVLSDIFQDFKYQVNWCLDLIHQRYISGQINLKDLRFPDALTKEVKSHFGYPVLAPAKSIAYTAGQMYASRIKRFNNPEINYAPKIKNGRSVRVKSSSGLVKIYNNQFSYRLKNGEWIDIPFFIPEKAKWKTELLQQKCKNTTKNGEWHRGGNLTIYSSGRSEYIMCFNKDFSWAYQPVRSFGFDLNRHKDNGIVFSEPIGNQQKIIFNDAIIKCIRDLNTLNKEWKQDFDKKFPEKRLRQKQRVAIRRKIQRKHRRLLKLIKPMIDYWFDYIYNNNLLLSIDNITVGRNMGSFGHDKIIQYLQKRCYDERIPFVLVPSYHTSQLCSQCNSILSRSSHDTTECPNCAIIDAHINAAKNIARFGWKIWEVGLKEFYIWKKSKIKPIKEPLTLQEFINKD